MGSFVPNGRLSAVDHGDQKIQIQTEFSTYPEPRVATTVSIGGQVVHKIQKAWGKTIDSLDEMRTVEEIINKQHNEVTELVHEHASTLLAHSTTTSERAHKAHSPEVLERIKKIPEVQSAFIVTVEGKLVSMQKVTKEAELLASMIGNLTDVLFDIARTTNLGECEDCILNLGSHDLLLLPYQGGYLAALTDTKVRKREVLAELWKIARAA
jgi:predicted regulator of Ras-like GTPase activity (Roadblock/LC7/MglB family)